MEIDTTRFGRLKVASERIITFNRGLLGFPELRRYVLIPIGHDQKFCWLQCVDAGEVAFVMADPQEFYRDYQVPLREETRAELEMADVCYARFFVICNRVSDWLTGNLQGPIVMNALNRQGAQLVLTERKWKTRQKLLPLLPELPLAKSA